MFKKLCAIICAVSLLGACSSSDEAADFYRNADGGWQYDVGIADLSETATTRAFRNAVDNTVYFELDSSSLSSEARDVLKTQAEWLNKNERALIVIEGRCDERGTREYNLALGERRANAARSYLTANGVAANRIRVISYGKDSPVVLGSTPEAWSRNRNALTVAY